MPNDFPALLFGMALGDLRRAAYIFQEKKTNTQKSFMNCGLKKRQKLAMVLDAGIAVKAQLPNSLNSI